MEHPNGSITLATRVTFLANERTILAYMRTSLTLLAAGVAFQEIFDKPHVQILGNLLIIFSGIILLVGVVSFIRNYRGICRHKETEPAQLSE